METSLRTARRALAQLWQRGKTTTIPEELRQVLVASAPGSGISWLVHVDPEAPSGASRSSRGGQVSAQSLSFPKEP